jgi:hypothetical protein
MEKEFKDDIFFDDEVQDDKVNLCHNIYFKKFR